MLFLWAKKLKKKYWKHIEVFGMMHMLLCLTCYDEQNIFKTRMEENEFSILFPLILFYIFHLMGINDYFQLMILSSMQGTTI